MSVKEDLSFQQWRQTVPPIGQRTGQHLMNTAPAHIYNAVTGVMDLDPFYVTEIRDAYKVNNFLAFAELVWDITDEDEIKLAMKMVLDEPNARR